MGSFMDRLRQFAGQIRDFWSNSSVNLKVLFAGAAILIVVAIAYLAFGSTTTTTYEVLYSDLSAKDAASVTAKLTELKIPYQVADNGTTITVPSEQKYDARFQLAAEGIPEGEYGFELFTTTNFGETQSDKAVKYQMALQGELARTIQSLEKVKSARVHLVIPEESLFTETEKKPSASVAITLKDDEELTKKETRGIVNLVANSVENLAPEDVVIVDQDGVMISEGILDENNDAGSVEQQAILKRNFEKQKQDAIQSMLDQALGAGNAVVRVSAELNFDAKHEESDIYSHDPGGPFVRSEQVIKESGTDVNKTTAATPGTDTNITTYTQAQEGSTTSTYEKSDKTTNYEINNIKTQTDYAPGATEYDYLTVSVLVNNKVSQNLGANDEERTQKIRDIVARSVGLREEGPDESVALNDNVSVAFIDFYTEPEPEPVSSSQGLPWMYLAAIAAVAFIALFIIIMLISRSRKAAEEEALERGFEEVIEDEIRIEDLIDRTLTPEEREAQKIREEIDKLIAESPESAVQVIRTWLMEDQR